MPERSLPCRKAVSHGSFAAALVLALAGLALCTTPARAQVGGTSDSAEERALDLNRRSAELYRQGNYAEAAALLREAYRLRPEPVLQFNLARACEMMADYACAVAAYESYLASRPADRAAIEARLAAARAQLAVRPPPSSPAAPVPAGGPSLLPPIVTATGAVGLGIGIALALVARGRHDDAVADPTQRGAMEKQESAESLMAGANVVLVTSGVVLAGGAVWWIIDATAKRSPSAPPAGASLRVGPGWIGVAGSF